MSLKEKIIMQLSINYDTKDDEIIDLLIEDYMNIASFYSHRKTTDIKLEPYVRNAVIQAYQRIGDEAMNSSTEGSQSYSFIDIEEKLAKDVQAIRVLC